MNENKEMADEQEVPQDPEASSESTSANTEEIINEETADETVNPEDLLKEEKNRYLRLFAEFENYKRRTTKEKFDSLKYASQDALVSMLPIADDFERALKEMVKRGNEDDLKGVELIFQKFKGILKEKGLKEIEVNVGDSFDVDQHEAITQIPAPSADLKGKILDVVQTGYILHDKVVRFAKVVVGA